MVKEVFTKSPNFNSRWCAEIARIDYVLPIEGKDLIEQVIIDGHSVVCERGRFTKGQVVILCKGDTRLCRGFLYQNSLYDKKHAHLNKDKKLSGYFEATRRVKIQKFNQGQTISEGYIFGVAELGRHKHNLADINLEDYLEHRNGMEVPLEFDEICTTRFIKRFINPHRMNDQEYMNGIK